MLPTSTEIAFLPAFYRKFMRKGIWGAFWKWRICAVYKNTNTINYGFALFPSDEKWFEVTWCDLVWSWVKNSKSVGSDTVRVQVPPPALKKRESLPVWEGFVRTRTVQMRARTGQTHAGCSGKARPEHALMAYCTACGLQAEPQCYSSCTHIANMYEAWDAVSQAGQGRSPFLSRFAAGRLKAKKLSPLLRTLPIFYKMIIFYPKTTWQIPKMLYNL